MSRFRLTDVQAQAILDMQLRRLSALERQKIEDEYKDHGQDRFSGRPSGSSQKDPQSDPRGSDSLTEKYG